MKVKWFVVLYVFLAFWYIRFDYTFQWARFLFKAAHYLTEYGLW